MQISNLQLPQNSPPESTLTQRGFGRGVITVVNESNIPNDSLSILRNMMLVEDGSASTRWGTDWYGTAPGSLFRTADFALTTNLLTNPSLESASTGWFNYTNSAGTATAATRSTTQAFAGTHSASRTTTGTYDGVTYSTITTVTAGSYYTVSAYVFAPVGMSGFLQVDIWNSGVYVRSTFEAWSGTGAWQRVSNTVTVAATGENGISFVVASSNVGTMYVDAAQIEAGPIATPYFDGATTDTDDTDYAWTGTANASTSTRKIYVMSEGTIDGGNFHETSDGAIHLWMVVGGSMYRSLDDGASWTACTGATFTSGAKCDSKQIGGFTYIVNGTDVIARYDGTTTLQTYTAITDPASAITLAATGMGGAGINYYYTYSDVNQVGFTQKAPLSSAIAVTKDRSRWDSSNFVTLTIPAAASGATRRDIFIATSTTDDPQYIASVPAATTTYVDDGSAPIVTTVTAPTDNTTIGPLGNKISVVGNRIWICGTSDDKIWWSGSGSYLGYFSTSYDGSWIILQKGSQYHPVDVEDYRDGKGTPFATVWRRSTDGIGDVWQIGLDTQTFGDVSFTVPNAYKLPGSRGTNAPYGIVNVLNDYIYPNSQAFYNLGSRAQFLNLLSTDEVSSNIRPTVKRINNAASDKIAGIYYDGKMFQSVPYDSSTTNNYTLIYDTEKKQKPWIPEAFTIGFERFFAYTDSAGARHLLAWKAGDSRFSEISSEILGDYGQPFETELVTGLLSVNPKNRFDWMVVDSAEVEFSQPTGNINIELAGTDRSKGFRTQKTKTMVIDSTVNLGYDFTLYDSSAYDDLTITTAPFSETSEKRYFTVQKELNNYQFRVTTDAKTSTYITRTLQINGTLSQGGAPRQWRL